MATIATGQKTIIDLQDGKSVTVYLSQTLPKTQIKNNDANTYDPNWSSTNLVITANVSVNGSPFTVGYTQPTGGCEFTWTRRDGSGNWTSLTTGETTGNSGAGTLVNDKMIVSANNLGSSTSGLLTYQVAVTYHDPDTGVQTIVYADISYSLVTTGVQAHSVTVTGDQVFKYTGSTPDPSSLTIVATLLNASFTKWEFWNYAASTPGFETISGQSTTTLTVSPSSTIWSDDIATVRAVATANISGVPTELYDVMSLYKVHDGGTGVSAPTAFLTNEMITFAGDADGYVASGASFTCNIVAYKGTDKVTPVINTSYISNNKIVVTGNSADIDITIGATSNHEIPLTISTNKRTQLGGAGEQHGQLLIPLTSPVSTSLTLNWGKVNTGEKGDSAVVMSVFAPDGAVFLNQEGTKTLEVSAYDGSTNIVTASPPVASYQWYVYDATQQNPWVTISGEEDYQYEVSGEDVDSLASFKCIMTYKNTPYSDIIDVLDKTDPYQAEIESTGGDKFKNTQGTSFLSCRIWQGASEADALKTILYSTVNPPTSAAASTAAEGSYCYYCPVSNYVGTWTTKQTVLLKKGSGGTWSEAPTSEQNTKTYTWTRRDKDGEAISGVFAIGKVIYIDGTDVDDKNTFICTVSDGAVS